jgi:hypothetical protein
MIIDKNTLFWAVIFALSSTHSKSPKDFPILVDLQGKDFFPFLSHTSKGLCRVVDYGEHYRPVILLRADSRANKFDVPAPTIQLAAGLNVFQTNPRFFCNVFKLFRLEPAIDKCCRSILRVASILLVCSIRELNSIFERLVRSTWRTRKFHARDFVIEESQNSTSIMGGAAAVFVFIFSFYSALCRISGIKRSIFHKPSVHEKAKISIQFFVLFTLSAMSANASSPILSALSSQNQPSSVGGTILLFGAEFIPSSISINIGNTASDYTSWVSTTSVVSMVGMGVSGSLSATIVFAAFLSSSITHEITYDVTVVSDMQTSNLMATDHDSWISLSLDGRNSISQTGHGRAGSTASESTIWTSETSIICKAAPGIESSKILTLSLGERIGTLSEILSFDRAELSSLRKANHGPNLIFSIGLSGFDFGRTR